MNWKYHISKIIKKESESAFLQGILIGSLWTLVITKANRH